MLFRSGGVVRTTNLVETAGNGDAGVIDRLAGAVGQPGVHVVVDEHARSVLIRREAARLEFTPVGQYSACVKKALLPILLIVAAIIVLAAGAYFYEQKWGSEGPFPDHHHDGDGHHHD